MEATRAYDWVLRPNDKEMVKLFVEQALLPHEDRIRALAARGDVPIVLFQAMPDMIAIFGARSAYDIIPMTAFQKNTLKNSGGKSFRNWLDRKDPKSIRIFAVIHMGTMLMHWVQGHELYIEPGSLDEDKDKP